MLIERPPQWFRKLFGEAVFRIPAPEDEAPVVYLTFDDGPIPEATPHVLEILDRFGVKATFFMVGDNVSRYPELLPEVLKRGHKVGNHTHHHIKGIGITPENYIKDVEVCAEQLSSDLFRPPHGWLTPAQLKKIRRHYKVVMYDLVTRDYSKKTTAENVVENVKRLARNGSIIVFHDSLKSIDKLKTALPESIEWLKGEGYKFEVL